MKGRGNYGKGWWNRRRGEEHKGKDEGTGEKIKTLDITNGMNLRNGTENSATEVKFYCEVLFV